MVMAGLVGIIGGTGLGQALADMMDGAGAYQVMTPFGSPSGPIMVGRLGRYQVAFLNRHGPGHRLNPSSIPYAANIFALKKLGVRTILATGAVGSLRARIRPGELVIVDQFIDKTYRRVGTFFDGYGAVHCEMADPVCARVRGLAIQAAKRARIKTHTRGTYVCMEGPQFSTRAESLMHRSWAGDLIGMTAMPEARLAREAQICYCLIGLVSDYDCWQGRTGQNGQRLLEYIKANIQTSSQRGQALVQAMLDQAGLLDQQCPCRHSLELAVWTDRDQISPSKRRAYRVLFL